MKILEFNITGMMVRGIKMKNLFSLLFLFLAIQCQAAWYPNYYTTNAAPVLPGSVGGLISNYYTANLAIDTYYTNSTAYFLQAVATVAVTGSAGNTREVSFYVDTDRDGVWDSTTRLFWASATAQVNSVFDAGGGTFIQAGARFMWTNTIGTSGVLDASKTRLSYFTTNITQSLTIEASRLVVNDRVYMRGVSNSVADAVNVIGGSPKNYIDSSVYASVIGGGGETQSSPDYSNAIYSVHSTISGGVGNMIGIDSAGSTIGGGEWCKINEANGIGSIYSWIGGGEVNQILDDSPNGAIGGGYFNRIGSSVGAGTIAGGYQNFVGANRAFIGGGETNAILSGADFAIIAGGASNLITAPHGQILGGYFNRVSGLNAVAIGNRLTNTVPFSVKLGFGASPVNIDSNNVISANGIGITNTGGYTMTLLNGGSAAPADSTTYFFGPEGFNSTFVGSTIYDGGSVVVPRSGTIRGWTIKVRSKSATASGETVSHFIRVNDTTDIGQIDVTYAVTNRIGSSLSLGTAVAAGDTIAMKVVCPAWATNPTGVSWYSVVFIE